MLAFEFALAVIILFALSTCFLYVNYRLQKPSNTIMKSYVSKYYKDTIDDDNETTANSS